ncbi:MAG: WapI family immunity protein [Planctomycetota bacterium]|jgi:hypothetical protein
MRIGTATEHLQLLEVERAGEDLPTPGDVRVSVSLRLPDLQVSSSAVWLEREAIQRFADDLSRFAETRKGHARLEAMSPDEFTLEIAASDELGHYSLAVKMSRHRQGSSALLPVKVEAAFEPDASTLDQAVADLAELL